MVAATTLVLLLPGLVAAHAELETSTPADTEVVEGTPAEISGTYSEAVKVDGSTLVVKDAGSGKELAKGGVDPDDDKRMVIDAVPALGPGDYIVEVDDGLADDDDIDREHLDVHGRAGGRRRRARRDPDRDASRDAEPERQPVAERGPIGDARRPPRARTDPGAVAQRLGRLDAGAAATSSCRSSSR